MSNIIRRSSVCYQILVISYRKWKKNSIQNIYFDRTFIQALLLNSVFHEGLSFMEVGHNPMCQHVGPLHLGIHMGCYNPHPCAIAPGSFGYFTDFRFSDSLSMHHLVT